MSGNRPFTRQLGSQPGNQLNPLADNTDGVSADNSDQVIALAGRFSRGRIDRPFMVTRSNLLAKTGVAESIRSSLLNEAKMQAYEALNNGAVGAVVMRMTKATATSLSYAVVDMSSAVTAFSTASAVPTSGTWTFALLDHECFNDGIQLAVHANTLLVGGLPAVNPVITLQVLGGDGVLRYQFTGSFDPNAKDDYGVSMYLPDVIASRTDNIQLVVASGATGVLTTSDAYGRGSDNKDKWATSATLVCFVEGATSYTAADYDRFIDGLRQTTLGYGYLISGGSQSASFLGKLASLAEEINVPAKFDAPGTLTPADAMTFTSNVNLDNHYIAWYWAPLEADDPMNGGKAVWGTAGLNAGLSCARNAQRNGKGFAPKQYPIAGKPHPIQRTGVRQIYTPDDTEKSDMSDAKINPVIFQNFNGGGSYVFTDCLTTAKTVVSYRKLIPVAEMAATLDDNVTMYSNEILMYPMEEYIKRMKKYLDKLLEDAKTSGWLKNSQNLPGNAAFQYDVSPSEERPADVVVTKYWTSFDGVVRQGFIQQTLSR